MLREPAAPLASSGRMAATAADMSNNGSSAPIGSTLLQLGGTVNRRWVEDKSAFGRRMLEKMGWKEGKGLGKNEDGDATFVKIDRRIDHEGVGQAAESLVGDSQFKKNLTNFNDVLKSLSQKAKVESKQAKKQRKKTAKKNKKTKKKQQKRRNQAPALTVDKRRVRSKNARAYSQHDLNQVLGIDSDPWAKGFHRVAADPSVLKARAPQDAVREEDSDSSSSSSSSSDDDDDGTSSDSSSSGSEGDDSSSDSSDSESEAAPAPAKAKEAKKKQSKKRKQSQPEAPPPKKKTKEVKKKKTKPASSTPTEKSKEEKKKSAKKSKKAKKKAAK